MPVFDPNKTAEETPTPQLDHQKPRKSATVNSTKQPLTQLITHIDGYAWTVQYYAQVLGPDDTVRPLDLDLDPTIQQYHYVQDLEFRVSEELTYEYIPEQQKQRLEGAGTTHPGMPTPNRGDMFYADVGTGTWVLFTLTDVTPLSYLMEKCYAIRYMSVADLTDPYSNNLTDKTVKTSFFRKDFLIHGRNPILEEETVSLTEQLGYHSKYLLESHVSVALDPRKRLYLLPEQESLTYDSQLASFMRQIVDVSQHPQLRNANWPSVERLQRGLPDTLWSLLLQQSPVDVRDWSNQLLSQWRATDSWQLKGDPSFGGLYYIGVRRVLWADGLDADWVRYEIIAPDSDDLMIQDAARLPEEPMPMIRPVLVDNYYVFSEAFYLNDRPAMSTLERFTTMMLNREALPEQELIAMCEVAYSWPKMERFYYIPILLILIKYATERL